MRGFGAERKRKKEGKKKEKHLQLLRPTTEKVVTMSNDFVAFAVFTV